ncbi:MAG: hypothetical protein HZA24_00310 [Nitrospirae bacterium]|nr:hypothetical protein [Nitrospirota bacterium]
MRELAQQHGPEAIAAMVDLMRSAKLEAVRLAAAEALLSRGYGKPAVQIGDGPDTPPLTVIVTRYDDPERTLTSQMEANP